MRFIEITRTDIDVIDVEVDVIVIFTIMGKQMCGHYDTEFNVDWFDQLIGYSPVISAMWPKMREDTL